LQKQDHSVIVVDDLSSGNAEAIPSGVGFVQADIGDRGAMRELLSQQQFDAVFHFAAKALIPESVSNPGVFFDRNLPSGIALVEELRAAGVGRFIFSSTAAVYGSPTIVPIREDDPKEPVNSYGESKLAFERVLKWYASAYGWSVIAFRYFNACGSAEELGERHEPETHIIPLLLHTALGRRSYFEIFGNDYPTPDGTCVRDYVHVLDIVSAHILALEHMTESSFEAYNIGTGFSHSVAEVCQVVEKVTKQRIDIRIGRRRPGDPAVLCASPDKLQRTLGWIPVHSNITNIVESAWKWEQRQAKLQAIAR
jgi:UDP-glucose 4-epimerase